MDDKLITPVLVGLVAPITLVGIAVARRQEASDGERRSLITGALLLSLVWTLRDKKSRASGFNQTFGALTLVGVAAIWAGRLIYPPDPAANKQLDPMQVQQMQQAQFGMPMMQMPMLTQGFAQPQPYPIPQGYVLGADGNLYPREALLAPPGSYAPVDDSGVAGEVAEPEAQAPKQTAAPARQPAPKPRRDSLADSPVGRQAQARVDLARIRAGLEAALDQGIGADMKFWDSANARDYRWIAHVLLDYAQTHPDAFALVSSLPVGQLEEGRFGIGVPLDDDPNTDNQAVADITQLAEYIGKRKQQEAEKGSK